MEGLHKEITALTRKSPNDAVNEFKLRFINSVIAEANLLLGDKYKPLQGFEQFNSDDLPSNSDVTFIIWQYIEKWRGSGPTISNYTQENGRTNSRIRKRRSLQDLQRR